MSPGRELDALVAEKVMGGRRMRTTDARYYWNGLNTNGELPAYSTDIAAAWTVVERLGDKFNFIGKCADGWNAVLFYDGNSHGEIAPSAPHAICLAALKAVGVEI